MFLIKYAKHYSYLQVIAFSYLLFLRYVMIIFCSDNYVSPFRSKLSIKLA